MERSYILRWYRINTNLVFELTIARWHGTSQCRYVDIAYKELLSVSVLQIHAALFTNWKSNQCAVQIYTSTISSPAGLFEMHFRQRLPSMCCYMLRKSLFRIPRTDGVVFQPVAEVGLEIILRVWGLLCVLFTRCRKWKYTGHFVRLFTNLNKRNNWTGLGELWH